MDEYDFIDTQAQYTIGVEEHGTAWWGLGDHQMPDETAETDWDAVEDALETLDTVPGMENLVREAENMTTSIRESGFECPVCGLCHGHDSDKHDVRTEFAITEEFAERMQYNPYCHCGVNELARLVNFFDAFEIQAFEDEGEDHFNIDKRRSQIQSASSSAPIPDSTRQDMNESLGTV
jgi:hypothetical protein